MCSQLLFPYQAIECLSDFVHHADGISLDIEPALQGNLLEVQSDMSVGEAVGHCDELPVEDAEVPFLPLLGRLLHEGGVKLIIYYKASAVGFADTGQWVALQQRLQIDAE